MTHKHDSRTKALGKNSPSRRAWTLMELLIVIAIIAILVSLLYPTFSKTRDKTRNVACKSNLKQLAITYELMANTGIDVNKDGIMNGSWNTPGIETMNGQTDMRRGDIMQRGWFFAASKLLQSELKGRTIATNIKYYSCPQIGTPEIMDWDAIAYNPNIHWARTKNENDPETVPGRNVSLKRSSIANPSVALMMMDGGQTHSGPANWSTGSAWSFGYMANWEDTYDLKSQIQANRHFGKQNFTRWDGSLSELSVAEIRAQASTILKLK
jgi:prepilin-type N-terminal cleavage/methylation domain-containing protein